MEIKRITTNKAKRIFSSCEDTLLGNRYKPLGRFFVKERNGHFTAIDNSDGSAWCEEFKSYEDMVKWFEGDSVVDAHGNILND